MTPLMKCSACKGQMQLETTKAPLSLGARRAAIEFEQHRCNECGEIFLTAEQMMAAQRELARVLRERERLLSPERIRAIRMKCGLSQEKFEQLLGVGPQTVVRWERGTVFQNRATYQLLRVIEAVPGALTFLAHANGVSLPQLALASAEPPTTKTFILPSRELLAKYRRPKVTHIHACLKEHEQQKGLTILESETKLPEFPAGAMK